MKFSLYLLMGLTFISCNLFSQNAKISGKVTEEDGDGLINATVVIDASKGWAAVTDIDGNYAIDLPGGSYEITFHYVGKEQYRQKITVAAGEKRILNIIMKEQQKLMDEVEISGSKYEKKLSEETVSLDVVKGSSLANQNITDLENGMNHVPGVTIADGQLNIRGGAGWSYGAGSRVQVLIDDLPLLTADANDAKWSIVPMENVDQIEVIKGAASALYGSGALNGIVNVRTAYPTDEPYFKMSVYSGAYDNPSRTPDLKWWGSNTPIMNGTSFAYRQKFGQNDLVIGGAFDANSGYLDSSDSHDIRVNAKYRYRFKNVPGLNIGVNASAYYSWGKTFFFWKGLDSLGYQPYPNTITVYKSYRFTVDPFIDYYDKRNNHFKLLTRFFNATNTNNTGQGSVPNRYYAELQYIRKVELRKVDFNFVGGVVNVYDEVNPPSGSSGSLFGKNSAYNFSAYAQADFKFFKRLNVSFGARWEYFDMIHYVQDSTAPGGERLVSNQNSLHQLPYPLFRVGLNYQAAEATYIRASFGQGFRYPSIAERYITTQVGPLYVASNPNLQPEKGYGAELGIKQGFKLGSDWMGYADLAGFWNRYDNMMEFTFGQFGDTNSWHSLNTAKNQALGLGFSSQNIGKTQIFGTEFDLAGQGKIGPIDIQLVTGYTYIDPRSLNWNTPLTMYNYQGAVIQPYATYSALGLSLPLFNEANNPNPKTNPNEITYGMTSTSSSNLLKYRNQHTFKIDVTLGYKELEINTNLQYASFEKSIDYAFVSQAFTFIGSSAFGGLKQYLQEKVDIPIGNGRGDVIWNAHIAYNFKIGVRVAFIVKNLLNWEYTPRPAIYGEPRNYTAQVTYTFKGKTAKQKASGL